MDRPPGRHQELVAAAGFGMCVVASTGLVVVYARGGDAQMEGALLAVAFLGLAVGLVRWANHLLESGPHTEEREVLPTSDEERADFASDLERAGTLGRRPLLVRGLVAAAGALGVAALVPIRSLGPSPGALSGTAWQAGRRLVTSDGRPVLVGDVPLDGLVTVFPEGEPGSADGQAVLIRVGESLITPRPGREAWAVQGLLAYSKVCTHAGCPVGLYQSETHLLLCPCHQSAFDVLDGGEPVFGPAAWPLPQLPLSVDDDGVLYAAGDFSEPVGPGYWSPE